MTTSRSRSMEMLAKRHISYSPKTPSFKNSTVHISSRSNEALHRDMPESAETPKGIQNQLRIQVGKFVISADGMTSIILYGALKVEMGSELLVERHALIESKEGYDQSDEDFFNLIKFLKKRVLCFNNDFIALCFKQGWKDALSSGIRTYSDAFSLDAFPCLMLKKDNLITHNTVIIKNYYSNVAAVEGLSFKIDKIVQAWNEMFDTKHPQSGVPLY
ncbi:hypothetical protein Tco_0867846 [Tanacetum coccineum]